MSSKRARSPTPKQSYLFKSSPIKERSSTFVAVFSPTYSPEALQSLPEYKSATHRMTAWRRPGKQQQLSLQPQEQQRPVFETGYDDDGEPYGGKTLEKVLREAGGEGSLMVARWFGGVMLGPVRFDHIRNCGSDALSKSKQRDEAFTEIGDEDDHEDGRAVKRAKDADEGERQKLISILEERDTSVDVLRGLLAEKKAELEGGSSQRSASSLVSSPKSVNYATTNLEVLKRLEQVRDKTIGWILAQIEEVEKALLSREDKEVDEVRTCDSLALDAEKEHDTIKRSQSTTKEGSLVTETKDRGNDGDN